MAAKGERSERNQYGWLSDVTVLQLVANDLFNVGNI